MSLLFFFHPVLPVTLLDKRVTHYDTFSRAEKMSTCFIYDNHLDSSKYMC